MARFHAVEGAGGWLGRWVRGSRLMWSCVGGCDGGARRAASASGVAHLAALASARRTRAQAARQAAGSEAEEPESGGAAAGGAAAAVQAALAGASGAEVVCIIRSADNPRAASRVVIINRASRKFVADLLGEVDAQAVVREVVAQADFDAENDVLH